MMKETKKRALDEQYKLGTTEFATFLNGDDGRQIITALKTFVRTVKRERRITLDLDDDSNSSDEENDDEVINSNKKLKEEWMEDINAYNVPFVGTSVSKGDTGRVVVGKWPSGFIEAYLRQSPLAVELTSDNLIPPAGQVHKKLLRQKLGKTSFAIYRAYLQALAELVTAAIPISTLKGAHGMHSCMNDSIGESQEQPKFISLFIKDRFPDLIQVLNDETGSGRGKAGSIAGVGQLAAPVLQIMTYLASSSLGTSRQVVRALDSSVRDGVLKVLLREPRKSHEKISGDSDMISAENETPADRLAVPYKTRATCLQLANALLQRHDPSITSYISTIGSRERKNAPGILYLSLRFGFEDSMFHEREECTRSQKQYLESLSVLLQGLLALFADGREGLLSKRALADLLGADAILNISHAAAFSPPLTSYKAVLKSEDEYQGTLTSLEEVGINARRLLFLLLSDASRSPFLKRISGKDDDKLSTIYMTFMVKALNQLLCANPSIESQNFILYALKVTPLLLSGIFRYVKIPDVNSTFSFLSRLRLLARIVNEGPPPSVCLVMVDMGPRGINNLMSALLPQHLNKQVLTRALQSSNPLTVSEAAKLIICVISRFQRMIESCKGDASTQKLFHGAILSHLPDVQAILTTRSRFDPFKREQNDAVFVNALICRLIEKLAESVPMAVTSAKFDWMKLLPDPIALFRNAKPVSQLRILQTLENIIICKSASLDDTSKPSSKACCALLEVCMSATGERIYATARSLVMKMILLLLDCPTEQTEESYCMKYEVSLWIDALNSSVLCEFRGLLDDSVKNAFIHKLYPILAWKKANMPGGIPKLPFTLLLPAALSRLDTMSGDFACLVLRIAVRCQLFHSNPVPMASIIYLASTEGKVPRNEMDHSVQEYAKCVLDVCRNWFDRVKNHELGSRAKRLVEAVADFPTRGSSNDNDNGFSHEPELNLRHCLQAVVLFSGFEQMEDLKPRWIGNVGDSIRGFLRKREFEPIVFLLQHPAVSRRFIPNSLRGLLDLVAVVCKKQEMCVMDNLAANLASRLAKSRTKIVDLDLFDLLQVWFNCEFTTIHKYDDIGADLVRLATVPYAANLLEAKTWKALAVRWRRNARTPMSVKTAWEAWVAYTSNTIVADESDYQMIRLMEEDLCRVAGEQDCILVAKIHELGCLEFLRRCLRSLLLAKSFDDTSRDKMMSLLSKAIDLGCDDVGNILVTLTAAQGEAAKKSILTKLCLNAMEFKQLWNGGFLDGPLISVSTHRNDALMRRSLTNTLRETNSPHVGYFVARKFLRDTSTDVRFKSSAHVGLLLKTILSFCDSEVCSQEDWHFAFELTILVDIVPHALKRVFKVSHDEEGCVSFCSIVLRQCLHAIENGGSDIFIRSPLDLEGIIKSCLKYGISDAIGELADLRSSCLNIVRQLLSSTSRSAGGSSISPINPGSVWTMALSHSKFTAAVIPSEGPIDNRWERATEALVNLLVSCASFSPERLQIEKRALDAMLLAYNGGTIPLDMALRRLFYLLESMDVIEMPSTKDIVVCLSSSSSIQRGDSGSNLLGNVLDVRRIQMTISQFPRFVFLTPLPLAFENWASSTVKTDIAVGEDLDDSQDLTEVLGQADKDETATEAEPEGTTRDDIWRGNGPDQRYDPSFVIPLIVSALEGLMSDVGENEPHSGQNEDFARLAQSLCDKGGLSLCLASLCSACPALRKLAFSSLCLFLLALDSDAAKDLTTWRERPQLKMLVTSVQVGFVLRRSMLVTKGLGTEIPKLPSLSAIFLSKASLILSKPADPLYSAINKYFLKLNQNHGAYNDMTRLPAFISLFCSSSDEHPTKERQWALQCLRDSFLGGYHMVSSCHAPELLLTTLGQNRFDDAERCLILQVLTRLFHFGGKQATHHLLDRIGLLPWLQVIVVTQTNSETILAATLDLVEVAVCQGKRHIEVSQRGQLVMDILNLLVPIATLHSNSSSRTFCFMARTLSELCFTDILSPAGLSVSQCLGLIAEADDKADMLEALCCVPLHPGVESDAPLFCETMLRTLAEISDSNVELVLTRVHDLVRRCETVKTWPSVLLRLILSMYTRAVRFKAYKDCITALLVTSGVSTSPGDTEDEWVSLAVGTLKIMQENGSRADET